MKIFINTWVYENEVKKGIKQEDLFERIKANGADGIEVRREYFKDISTEIEAINQKREQTGLLVNYSVPDEVFEKDGSINPSLEKYFNEAMIMGITKIKFNLGNFRKYRGNLKQDLKQFPLDKIKMNIENDQTEISGKIKNIKYFLQNAQQNGVKIGYVYDLGNWAFTHQSADSAAHQLSPYVDYIHLKNTFSNDDNLETSNDLNSGMFLWKDLLKKLPKVDIALEYPMDSDQKVRLQLELLKNEVR
ncbi:sugar phosphate isomerase/epimerase family protein [Fructilactobacillus frigidiflavus]|uniref:sugar phosphate isomerase/epimerase family protein n=1 Tax=Fructilactobacillus frigidiflavus TaxID=3242688 RepID=UPI003757A0BE